MSIIPYTDAININPSDKQTVVIQYEGKSNLALIQKYIRDRRRNQSHIVISDWVCIDGFVNLDYDINEKNGTNRCARVVYELLDGNPAPSPLNTRFPDCYILRADMKRIREELGYGVDTPRLGREIHETSCDQGCT